MNRTPHARIARPVLDIRGLTVHHDGTLILDRLDRLDQRVERRPDLLPPEGR